jgi:hypothetical protein
MKKVIIMTLDHDVRERIASRKGQLTLVFFSLHVVHPLEGFPQYTILNDCKSVTRAVPNRISIKTRVLSNSHRLRALE